MKRFTIVALAMLALFLGTHSAAARDGTTPKHARLAFVAVDASGVTGSVSFIQHPRGEANFKLVVRGLTPGMVYSSFFYEGGDCSAAHDLLGTFTADARGNGQLHGKIEASLDHIGSVSVRLGPDYGILLACASMSAGPSAPTVISTLPTAGAVDVGTDTQVSATFSEAMDPATINASTFVLMQGTTAVPGAVSYTGVTATFTPASSLAPNTVYTATITTGAKDLAGNALAADFTWSFTTASAPVGQLPVALGSAGSFAVLAGSTVTNTGPSTVNGDLGVSPGTALTGFPPGIVNGSTHLGDAAAAQAQVDLAAGYDEARQRTTGQIRLDGDLARRTLVPGLYYAPSSLEITAADVTLDAQGDANAVFVFKIATTLTVASARQVILTGGANSANVFWLVGTSATLGTGAVFKGNILAQTSITVNTGVHFEGRALAETGAVTLDTDVIGPTPLVNLDAPTVSYTVPANGATGVAVTRKLAVVFSEPMDPGTINSASFLLTQGTTPVAGTVDYSGVTATFTPTSPLSPLTSYTARITTAAKDVAGHALLSSFAWAFTTGLDPDLTSPTVSAVVPIPGATEIALNQAITVAFSEAMDPTTINAANFTLMQGTTPVPGTVSYAGVTATFTPASNLSPTTAYTAKISTGAEDLAANHLASDFSWTFTTGSGVDATAPTVLFTVPATSAMGIGINQTVNATFSEAMNPLSLNAATFTLAGPGATAILGTVSYDVPDKIATFTPASSLVPNTVYTATITTGAKDLAGNTLAANFTWSFTTASVPVGQLPVALGSASSFVVLAGSTITNTGPSTVNGDLGLSPGTALTGFPPGIVNGSTHLGDAAAAQAQVDLAAGYNEARQRTTGQIRLDGDLAGRTLVPGLYFAPSSLEITTGDVTLDAQGDVHAVFVFQIATTLTVASARQVILTGGANSANVFWLVGTSATLGTGAVFKGSILAQTSITVNTGVHFEGRALAETGAVTLDNAIIGPAPVLNAKVDAAVATAGVDGTGVPNGVSLKGNPVASGSATIRFGLARADQVNISIYNVAGRMVRALVNGAYPPGAHEVAWDRRDSNGRTVARGVYFTRVTYDAQRFVATEKLMIMQ